MTGVQSDWQYQARKRRREKENEGNRAEAREEGGGQPPLISSFATSSTTETPDGARYGSAAPQKKGRESWLGPSSLISLPFSEFSVAKRGGDKKGSVMWMCVFFPTLSDSYALCSVSRELSLEVLLRVRCLKLPCSSPDCQLRDGRAGPNLVIFQLYGRSQGRGTDETWKMWQWSVWSPTCSAVIVSEQTQNNKESWPRVWVFPSLEKTFRISTKM